MVSRVEIKLFFTTLFSFFQNEKLKFQNRQISLKWILSIKLLVGVVTDRRVWNCERYDM